MLKNKSKDKEITLLLEEPDGETGFALPIPSPAYVRAGHPEHK